MEDKFIKNDYFYSQHFPDPGSPDLDRCFRSSRECAGGSNAGFVELRPPPVPDTRYILTGGSIKTDEFMKKPILTSDQRKWLGPERPKFQIELIKFKREFGNTGLGKLTRESVKAVARVLGSISGRWILFSSITLFIVALVVIFHIKVYGDLPVLFFIVVPIACHFIWIIYKTIFKQH